MEVSRGGVGTFCPAAGCSRVLPGAPCPAAVHDFSRAPGQFTGSPCLRAPVKAEEFVPEGLVRVKTKWPRGHDLRVLLSPAPLVLSSLRSRITLHRAPESPSHCRRGRPGVICWDVETRDPSGTGLLLVPLARSLRCPDRCGENCPVRGRSRGAGAAALPFSSRSRRSRAGVRRHPCSLVPAVCACPRGTRE